MEFNRSRRPRGPLARREYTPIISNGVNHESVLKELLIIVLKV